MKKTLTLLLLLAGLTLDAQAEPLTWNGAEGHMTWNTSYYYWLQGDTPALYTNGSDVVFGDNGSGEVTLAGDLKPASVLVDSSKDYTFSGDGKLVGEGTTLTKSGSGTLTINTANDYTGGTSINGGTLVLGDNKALGKGSVILGSNATLNLNDHTLSNTITLNGDASIGNGTFNGNLTVGEGKTLTLFDDLTSSATISLGDNATLDLDDHTFSNSVTLTGDATIDNGAINGDITVDGNMELFIIGTVSGKGTVILGHNAFLNLDGGTLDKDVIIKGSSSNRNYAQIYSGTLNGDITVGENVDLSMSFSPRGTGTVTLGDGAHLYASPDFTLDVYVAGNASVSYGTLNGNVTVAEGKSLFLTRGAAINGTITVGNGTTLDMGGGQAKLSKFVFTGQSATVDNGTLLVESGETVSLNPALTGSATISLGDNATLDLDGHTFSNSVTLTGRAAISNGAINGDIIVDGHIDLHIIGTVSGEGSVILDHNAFLNLDGGTLDKDVIIKGSSSNRNDVQIHEGTLNGDVIVGENVDLRMSFSPRGTGTVTLGDGVHLYASPDFTLDVYVAGNASVSDGTLNGNVTVAEGKSLFLTRGAAINGTITSGKTTVKALNTDKEGLLQEISVSDGLIAGTDRKTSLADGLYIESEANLMIKNMTITANNEIHVGEHTITLQDVTIKLSDDICELKERTFYFDLTYLINCDLVMENVLLDASDLTLPPGFDPAAVDAVVFDFGEDVTITEATGLDMREGNYWSPSLNLVQQGKVIFTKLVETPEPTTGVLSLLALSLLAGRRRRRN